MGEKIGTRMVRASFYAFYQKWYAPVFSEIDVTLKTMEKPLTIAETAALLHMTENEVRRVMTAASVTRLNRSGFFTVMRHGDNAFCQMYQRELTRGVKAFYSPSDIAYIYGLEDAHVCAVCARLGIAQVPAQEVPSVLKQISVFILY